MKQVLLTFFCFFLNFLHASPFVLPEIIPLYIDDELDSMWASLRDLHHPSAEDFIKIQSYLKYGRRPYLDILFDHLMATGVFKEIDRSTYCSGRVLQDITFIGPNQELPRFEKLVLGGASPEDKSRCIILYASFNSNWNPFGSDSYIKGIFNLLDELKQVGYKGHVLYRLGGYPLIEKGGIRFIHVPYSFKLLSFIEASQLGYEDILWIDGSMHPTNDLTDVFSKIQTEGSLLLFNGVNLDYDFYYNPPIILPVAAVESAGLHIHELNQIPHVISGIIGISFRHQKTHDLIKEWYRLTSLTLPAMTLYPEEFLLSVSSWRTHNKPNGRVWEYFDVRSVIPIKPIKAKKPFWFDKS